MDTVCLEHTCADGSKLTAIYTPSHGMNLLSYQKNGIEVIDQNTKHLFEERYAGLGALIGPHFHRRNDAVIPPLKDESLFPHIAEVKAKGVKEPFSHGIARYAPWKCTHNTSSLEASLEGSDEWKGIPVSELEGQGFKILYTAKLNDHGLNIDYSIVSDSASVIGFHYYYALPKDKGVVRFENVRSDFRDTDGNKEIPKEWKDGSALHFTLDKEADYGFYPSSEPIQGEIQLDAVEYKLKVNYSTTSQENSWQLYHPKGETFVCIEPLTAQNPRKPILSVSSLKLNLYIEC